MNIMCRDIGTTQQELKKMFPEEYFSKYGNHLRILQFEKNIIKEQANKTTVKFKSRDNAQQRRIKSAIPKQQIKKVTINYFDTFEDVIMKNKIELKRIDKFNSILQMKLKITPDKKNVIRSPSKLQRQLQQSVYLKMKAAEDMQFQRKQKFRRNLKMQLQKSSVCKFTNKIRPSKSSGRMQQRCTARTNPEKVSRTHRQLAKKLQQIALQSLQRNESIHMSCSKPLQRDAQLINSVNSAMKKSKKVLQKAGVSERQQDKILKLFKKRAMIKSVCGIRQQNEKKDLVKQTSKIKQQTKSMMTLKRYDVILEKRAAIKNLQSL